MSPHTPDCHLLIDAGNTRLKWRLVHGSRMVSEGALDQRAVQGGDQDTLAHWLQTLSALPLPRRALGCNVAGAACAEAVTALLARLAPDCPLTWLTAGPQQAGVTNRYDHPQRLGSDRWAAVIGAHHRFPDRPCLVVTAGTATTLDIVMADGTFQGGAIVPGIDLMRRSLRHGTADLPLAEGHCVAFPRNTDDAITTGCLEAQAGAIERLFQRIATHATALCILNGGNGPLLAPLLHIPHVVSDNLVLHGLARCLEEKS